MGGSWEGSDRCGELPADWAKTRAAIWRRDAGRCQWPGPDGPCGWAGRDVDHKQRGNDHSDANLWVLCGWHHDRKTAREGNQARTRVSRQRPAERHPGLI